MAVLANSALTMGDHAKRIDPDGKAALVAEILGQTNEILEDMTFKEGNLATGEQVTIRTGLPTVYWRSINKGVPSSKSTTVQVTEACGMLEARSTVDKELIKLNGDSAQLRVTEAKAFIEAMNQTQAQTLLYGNPANDPRQYLGLAPRYSNLSAGNAQNIIDAGGTASNNTSIYLVVWGDNSVYGTFPKGTEMGLQQQDLGEQRVLDADGNPYQAMEELYNWKNGLVVKDWRYCVRICNINTANLVAESSAADIVKLLSRALDRIPNLNAGKVAIYMNRTVHSMLRIQAVNKSSNALSIEKGLTQFGHPAAWTSFLGYPLRKVDQLLNTEARVV